MSLCVRDLLRYNSACTMRLCNEQIFCGIFQILGMYHYHVYFYDFLLIIRRFMGNVHWRCA